MKSITNVFLELIRNERMVYYILEEGLGKESDIITVIYEKAGKNEIRLCYIFEEHTAGVRISGTDDMLMYKKEMLIKKIRELHCGYRRIELEDSRNGISVRIDSSLDCVQVAQVCRELLHKVYEYIQNINGVF